jgi:Asp-tRNA(Asn)/Glu-tRNA(Gln) amidotransferase A subunit family amidase
VNAEADTEGLERMTAAAAAAAIRDGRLTSRELTEACLARIDRMEPSVHAWTYLDRDHALAQANAADAEHRRGGGFGPLHGVPVGVKDIFDTGDMPTEDGTVLHAGRTPRRDAAAVAKLRQAGAVILGKTVTTELAMYAPGKTRNPHDTGRTPGGSSSGSAAAVASAMVPLALGSQTNGSTIRPAAYCGVYGFKPTYGLISRTGMLRLSRALDHVGTFARSIEDLAILTECLAGFDEDDPATRAVATPPLRATAMSHPPLPPRLAFVPSPVWEKAEAKTQDAFAELVDALGDRITRLDLPTPFTDAVEWHRTILETDLAVNLNEEYERGHDRLSPMLREMIERGRKHLAYDYQRALNATSVLNEALDEIFFSIDAFLTPAAPGVAPAGLDATGSPVFCSIWTLCGVPAISMPLLQDEAGLPLGVQLIGARGQDARLLRTARWLANLELD